MRPEGAARLTLGWGPGPMKRGDRRRRRTVGRIKCGDGDGGDPVGAHHAGPDVRRLVLNRLRVIFGIGSTRRQSSAEFAPQNEP